MALERDYPEVGYPSVDPGDLWAYRKGAVLDFSRPGKLRAECLNAHWFLSLDDARAKMEASRRYCNEDRLHGAIGHKLPISLTNHGGITSPPT